MSGTLSFCVDIAGGNDPSEGSHTFYLCASIFFFFMLTFLSGGRRKEIEFKCRRRHHHHKRRLGRSSRRQTTEFFLFLLLHELVSKGWSRRHSTDGRPFFVNHIRQTTQWERPTTEASAGAAASATATAVSTPLAPSTHASSDAEQSEGLPPSETLASAPIPFLSR